MGAPVAEYANKSDQELKQFILSELDQKFNGQASTHYIKHTFQHWGSETFVNGAYLRNNENWRRARTLGEPVSNKIYFAGEAYSDGEDWGSVHNAAQSCSRAIQAIIVKEDHLIKSDSGLVKCFSLPLLVITSRSGQ